MEFEFRHGKIKFNRELSNLDKLTIRFTKVLKRQKIDYVIISGYIAILFGRSRNTEDVDLFIEKIDKKRFFSFWKELGEEGFECVNTSNPDDAYDSYINDELALRFAVKGTIIPNFELKFSKTKYNIYSLKHKVEVSINNEIINTSELEMQIAFKLKLGSEKDFEDARHLYKVFKEHLNIGLLTSHMAELKVEKRAEKILWGKG